MWAVVGLGNPGRRYAGTRHNAGFAFIKRIAKEWKVKLRKKRYFSKVVEIKKEKERVLLATPHTYMNKSGLAVKNILEVRGIKPERLIVVFDDLDIPLGEIRIRKRGGPGTHKGMNSIFQEIQTTEYPRIRVGIGPLEPDEDAVNYVLSPFDKSEEPLLEEGLKKAQEALGMILSGNVEEAMNIYNKKRKTLNSLT
ncbi:MAG: aminoacyl-tRNA hydrolase [Candidatus Aminicenantes bacterium]|nr:aminoacyl-tRNA hydrolase [Candidatus Aminicenantes bacterium]